MIFCCAKLFDQQNKIKKKSRLIFIVFDFRSSNNCTKIFECLNFHLQKFNKAF